MVSAFNLSFYFNFFVISVLICVCTMIYKMVRSATLKRNIFSSRKPNKCMQLMIGLAGSLSILIPLQIGLSPYIVFPIALIFNLGMQTFFDEYFAASS